MSIRTDELKSSAYVCLNNFIYKLNLLFNIGGLIAFNQLRIRIGGSLEDQLLYDVGNLKYPCHPFRKKSHGLFGFSRGCLPMSRWDELNQFFSKTR